MVTAYVGEKASICQVLEGTLGTAITSENNTDARWYLTELPTNIQIDPGLIMDSGAGGDYRAVHATSAGMTTVQYSLTSKIRPSDNIGYWILGIMGSDAGSPTQQSDSTAYLHTFSLRQPGTTMPSFTHIVNKGWAQAYYNGAQMASLAFDFRPGQAAMMTAAFHAWNETAHSGMGTPSYQALRPYAWRDFAVTIGDGSDYNAFPGTTVEGAAFTFDRQATALRGAGNSGLIRELLSGPLKLTGTFDVVVTSDYKTEFADKFKAGTIISNYWMRCQGAIISGSYRYTLEIQIPNIIITSCPEDLGSGTLRASIGWEAMGADSSGTLSTAPVIKVINARSTTYN